MNICQYYVLAFLLIKCTSIICLPTNEEWREWEFVAGNKEAPETDYIAIDMPEDLTASTVEITELSYPNSFIFQLIESRKQYLAPYSAIAEQSAALSKRQISMLINFCNHDGNRTWQLATFAYKRLQKNDNRAVFALLQNVCLNKVLSHACRERYNSLISLCLNNGATNIEENIALLLCRDGQDALPTIELLMTRPWSAQKTLQHVQQWSQYPMEKTTFATHYFTHLHNDGKLHHIQYAINFLSQYI